MRQRRRCKGSNIFIHCMGHFRLENGVFFSGKCAGHWRGVSVLRSLMVWGLDGDNFGLRVGVIPGGYIFEIQ